MNTSCGKIYHVLPRHLLLLHYGCSVLLKESSSISIFIFFKWFFFKHFFLLFYSPYYYQSFPCLQITIVSWEKLICPLQSNAWLTGEGFSWGLLTNQMKMCTVCWMYVLLSARLSLFFLLIIDISEYLFFHVPHFSLLVCFSVSVSFCLFVSLSPHLSVCLSVCLLSGLAGWLACCPYLSLCLFVCLSVCLSLIIYFDRFREVKRRKKNRSRSKQLFFSYSQDRKSVV